MVSAHRRLFLSALVGLWVAPEAFAQSYGGGPLPFSIRTIGGLILPTTIRWSGDRRRLEVTHESGQLPPGSETDVSQTTRMLVTRATAINLTGPTDAARGEGVGYVGNTRYTLQIEHRVAGGRLRQVIAILGYNGRVFTESDARILFQ